MTDFMLVDTRGGHDESWHRLRVAVVDRDGSLLASAGDPSAPVFWRSAAKPFQLWPLVVAGGVTAYGLAPRHLALACASHSAEPRQRAIAAEWLERTGLREADLSCGGHPSLSPAIAASMIREDVVTTPLWSNCSGKHAALAALAQLSEWPVAGYESIEHPVQRLVRDSIAGWSGIPATELSWGVDGCTAAAVASPMLGLARAWCRLGVTDDPAMTQVREAILEYPELIAGADRLDTVLMQAWPGRVLVKVGAEGVYAAALPTLGLGIALKVEDGDMRAAAIALIAVLERILAHVEAPGDWPVDALARWREPVIRNTRGTVVGRTEARGALHLT
jgi:L-asparaginase II